VNRRPGRKNCRGGYGIWNLLGDERPSVGIVSWTGGAGAVEREGGIIAAPVRKPAVRASSRRDTGGEGWGSGSIIRQAWQGSSVCGGVRRVRGSAFEPPPEV